MLKDDVLRTIREFNMIQKGDRVTVALSGGADSVCLLLVLDELKETLGFTLYACHINHMIRGEESDRDENFCKSLCERLGIPIKVYKEDVPKAFETSGKSLELTARDIRYKKLAEAAGDGKIATAHTLSDSAETVVLNLARGTGLKGLCGIPVIRGNIIRPVIGVTREQVEQYLEVRNQSFVTDSTNLEDNYTRNRIRHSIMPQIFDINKGFYRNFSNMQKILYKENSFLEKQCEIEYNRGYEKGALKIDKNTPEVIRNRMIAKFLSEHKLSVSYDRINDIAAVCQGSGRINISGNTFITARRGVIFVENKTSEQPEVPLKPGGNSIFENSTVVAKIVENPTVTDNFMIDLNKVSGRIILRGRRYGDRIKFPGRGFTSTVKKLLNEKVPPQKRGTVHFLADDEGLIYMEGFGTAERTAPDSTTTKVLTIRIEENSN